MASSRGTLNGPDWKDVASATVEYTEMWGAEPEIRVKAIGKGRQAYLSMIGVLTNAKSVNGVVVPYCSASVNLRAGPAMATDAALLQLLYSLDVALYTAGQGFPPQKA